jgi:hypothetical protein
MGPATNPSVGPATFPHHQPAAAPPLLDKEGGGGVVPRLGGPDSLFYRAAAVPPSGTFQQQHRLPPHPFSAPGLPGAAPAPPASTAPLPKVRLSTYLFVNDQFLYRTLTLQYRVCYLGIFEFQLFSIII